MRVKLLTLGCRSNYFDTELMAGMLRKKEGFIISSEGPADIYIVNTCTVTSEADRSSRQAVYRAKRENPNAVVVVTGCYAQVNPEALANLKEVDIVIGNSHKHRIAEIVEEFLKNRGERVFVENIFLQSRLEGFDLVTYFEKARPFIKVQEGCNHFCTFCVIPYARGKARSVPIERVAREVELIADRGFQEVVLTGTQLTQYGWDMGTSLYELLKRLVKIEGIEIIRLSSLYPAEISSELLDFMTSEERIAPHFHMSLQSGSNKVLSLMKREYKVEEYIRLVGKIVSRRPISAIGTDIIVGFPMEEEEDFMQTYKVLEDLPVAYMHIFPYSDRPLTKASKMEGKALSAIKEERLRILKELDDTKRKEFYRKNIGRELRAVVLEEGKLLTENYLHIKGLGEPGRVIRVVLDTNNRFYSHS